MTLIDQSCVDGAVKHQSINQSINQSLTLWFVFILTWHSMFVCAGVLCRIPRLRSQISVWWRCGRGWLRRYINVSRTRNDVIDTEAQRWHMPDGSWFECERDRLTVDNKSNEVYTAMSLKRGRDRDRRHGDQCMPCSGCYSDRNRSFLWFPPGGVWCSLHWNNCVQNDIL